MTRKVEPPKPRPVGRPRSIPDGAVPRTVRMTDEEYAAVLVLLGQMRLLGGPEVYQPAAPNGKTPGNKRVRA